MPNEIPVFENPPVIEVVCGVMFKSVDSLLVPHFGLLWEKFRGEFQTCQEAPPLHQLPERFPAPDQIQAELVDIPPLPRVWFIAEQGDRLVQVQRDRFLFNWKKVPGGSRYPGFGPIRDEFMGHSQTFDRFLTDNSLGSLKPIQLEASYINHMEVGDGWGNFNEIGRAIRYLSSDWPNPSFAEVPEGVNLKLSYALPGNTGRLHVSIHSARRRSDGKALIVLELTARGAPPQPFSSSPAKEWFQQAELWLSDAFVGITTQSIQREIWKIER